MKNNSVKFKIVKDQKGLAPSLNNRFFLKPKAFGCCSAGFTLMEIIVAMSILSGIILVVTMFSLDIYDFGIFLGENIVAEQEIQLTLRVMASEIRAMSQSATGAYPIDVASQSSITFYSDIDGDGLAERVRYYLDATTFKKGVIKPTGTPLAYPTANEQIQEVVHNVYLPAGNIFAYYNSSYTGTQAALTFPLNISDLRLININITVDQSPGDSVSRINLSTSVNMRNL